jgi:plasmid stabilization system protein ParE
MTIVLWSPRALDDLDAIEAYIAQDNVTAARRLVARIVQRAKRIELFPESGRKYGICYHRDSCGTVARPRHTLSVRRGALRLLFGPRFTQSAAEDVAQKRRIVLIPG